MNDQNENLKKYNEEILADLTKVKEDDKTLKGNNENLLTKLKEHQQQSDDLLLQQKQSQIKINELKDLNNIINEQNSELKNHIDLLKGQINVLRENENSNMKHFKQNEDHTIGLKDQIEELKEALSTSQIESQESLSALKVLFYSHYFHLHSGSFIQYTFIRSHSFSTYAKVSENLTFLTPDLLEMLVFRKILRSYQMNDPSIDRVFHET